MKVTSNPDGTFTVRLLPEGDGKPQAFLYPLTAIEPLGSAVDHLRELRLGHPDHYRLLTNATRLSLVYEYDKLLSISNSRMVSELYQLMAVKKVMEALRQRFLIADDVGLGKTIEAGLIMQELTARHRGSRVLVVAPAALQDQWKKEMQRHFLRTFYIYNSRKMEGIRELVDEHLNPWLAKNSIVTSIDWVKPQYEGSGAARRNINIVFDQLMKVEKRWDLVMIDEAHYVSTEANRADLAKALQERCDSLLLLTATPHSGNPQHFFNILNLIDPFMFSQPEDLDRPDARQRVELVMIRRGKETIFEKNASGQLVKKFKERHPHPIEIEFTSKERDLYDAVSGYTGDRWAQLNKKKLPAAELTVGKFLLALVQKRMVSSLAALRETLKNRINSIVETRTVNRVGQVQNGNLEKSQIRGLLRSYERGDFMEDEERELVERYIEARRLESMYAGRTTEVTKLREILKATEDLIASGQDSKLEWLKEFLKKLFTKDPAEKVIIFTEYRDTLDYLKEKLEQQWFLNPQSIVIIRGGMALGEDDQEEGSKLLAERRFNEPDTRILLATDAASEGLNLQRHCHTMINYELPWNPNRLEQRIGRIHRYGQRHEAQIYNLMIKNSKEAQIFELLQQKIETIRRQLGNMAEVLGILERLSLDDLILRVLNKSVSTEQVKEIATEELKSMDEMAASIQKTQFLSGCRQFTAGDIAEAEVAVKEAQQAIPTRRDVQVFVDTFLRVYGDAGVSEKDGRKLHPTKDKGVFRLLVPPVLQDEKLPKVYPRVTFERSIATADWGVGQEPDFLAFGHPLVERMVHYCRVTKASELSGQLAYLAIDYSGLPGAIFNFVLRFEDQNGRVIREELEPVFVDQEGLVHPDLGRKLYLAPQVPGHEPDRRLLTRLGEKIESLQRAADDHIRSRYLDYYHKVETKRNEEIEVLMEDLERFNRGAAEQFQARLAQLQEQQAVLFDDPSLKGLKTRIENQIKVHQQAMETRRQEVEHMRLGAFPAPSLLNLVIVSPA
jgi:ERCC4-related helicase